MKSRAFFITIILLGLVVIIVLDRQITARFRESLHASLEQAGNFLAEELRRHVEERAIAARAIAWSASAASPAAFGRIASDLAGKSAWLQWAVLATDELTTLASWAPGAEPGPPPDLPRVPALQDALSRLEAGPAAVGGGLYDGAASFAYVCRVPGASKLVILLFHTRYPFDLEMKAFAGSFFYVRILDSGGRILASLREAAPDPPFTQIIQVHGVNFRIEAGPIAEAISSLGFQRFLIWAAGFLALIGCMGALFFISNTRAELEESNKILQTQTRQARELNEKLIETNKELDDFTYVVSHDLKEPLRGIEAFTAILVEEYGAKLDGEAHEYLQTLRASASRMKDLINDLLKLSRIGRRRYPVTPVPFREVVDEALRNLDFAIKQKNARLVIAPNLPTVYGERVRLVEVVQNLVSNAIKYCDKTQPVVEIGCQDQEDAFVFYVKDNGIGIEERYFDRIFQIFQRLHRQEEYEGTGAGLTVCKRIIEKHGGDIWVESQVGQGSAFFFSLPKNRHRSDSES
ncbi:MAG TPA: ATP-binding protein [Candidatus Brocadiia bacterium]|nr:ATP-binding protein [Candidatus Brocadiia bacterium]